MLLFKKNKGFTLLEFMIAIAIFTIITSIVIYNYGSFNSNILVTNLAYEMALAVRQAQVYGLSVRGAIQSGSYVSPDFSYGISFDISNPKVFYLYADKTTKNGIMDGGTTPCDGTNECQESFTIRGDVSITDLCIDDGSTEDCSINKLNAVFLRPNPEAIIFADDNPPGGDIYSDTLILSNKSATIEIRGSRSNKIKLIKIERTGQISVQDP